MFISSNEYATSANLTSTELTIIISETSYYIKNRQLPIAKLREIIFHTLLFTVVCIEIFRLIILLFKLTFLPLLNFITRHFQKKNEILSTKMGGVDHATITDDHDIIIDDHDITTITTTTTDNHDALSIITDLHDTLSTITDIYEPTTRGYHVVQIPL